ncbi:hypothetical protein [Winogradskyella bathintestinalis]|uniref:Uncharacterized protein n=1 Tax=Winogradskyella bathintestinalis TaxID=3035208 RepID=A0ABT7ZW61_9FLAO|nr:hypothetical protein [Winogradskyella bathintestinalis]MDN3493248.1 hypothetical protein [Winogradskyella bathintestinalis]
MENFNVLQLDFDFEVKPVLSKEKVVTPTKKENSDFVLYFMDC